MKRATAIVGACFGDEGKGAITDYVCSQVGAPTVVVRFNGGAQAGHTVVADGRRHVFHHIGAGTFAGAGTYLSRFFVANPVLWDQEWSELYRLLGGKMPPVWIDREAPLTTIYDMVLNQEIERSRGGGRHGSCGVGFHETLVRNESTAFATCVGDLLLPEAMLRSKLRYIREIYVPARLMELGISKVSPEADAILSTDVGTERFVRTCNEFAGQVEIARDYSCITPDTNVVFEGAQGLLLDQDSPFFPHVTHSKTGLRNVVTLCRETGIKDLDVTYVTRAYMTRHGAGPFPTEDPDLSYPDDTNVPHDFQGTLRFGRLDIDLLANSIRVDLKEAQGGCATWGIAITHLDQVADGDAIVRAVTEATNPGHLYLSYGPSRDNVRMHALP